MGDVLHSAGELVLWVLFIGLVLFGAQGAARGLRAGRVERWSWQLTSNLAADKDTRDADAAADDLLIVFGLLRRALRTAILGFEWMVLAVTTPLFAAIGLVLRLATFPVRWGYRYLDERDWRLRRH